MIGTIRGFCKSSGHLVNNSHGSAFSSPEDLFCVCCESVLCLQKAVEVLSFSNTQKSTKLSAFKERSCKEGPWPSGGEESLRSNSMGGGRLISPKRNESGDFEGRSEGLWSDVILGRQVGCDHGCELDTETRGPAYSWNLKVFPRQLSPHSFKVQISIPLLLLSRNLGEAQEPARAQL